MFFRFVAVFSIATLVSAQTPHMPLLSTAPAPASGPVSAPVTEQTLTVPAGTAIPLTLINPIKKKSTRPGDAVRATVAFPVMAGARVAIPAGSYVEGEVKTVTARAADTHLPAVNIHFSRLVYANGYSVDLDANSAQAEVVAPRMGAPTAELAANDMPKFGPGMGGLGAYALQATQPTLPPLSNPGPSPAVVTGAVLGGGAALTVLMYAIMHHQQSKIDYVLFDSGWQFQMVLEHPLVVDASRVAVSAAAAPPATSNSN